MAHQLTDKLSIIYSSSLLRRIWHDPEYQAVGIDFWAGHVFAEGNQFYTYRERLQLVPGEQSYQGSQPRLVKSKGNQQPDSEKLRQLAIRKINWAAQRKHSKGYMTILELNQCLLSELDRKVFATLLEETKEAAMMLEDKKTIILSFPALQPQHDLGKIFIGHSPTEGKLRQFNL